jgi:hypothetical protein
MHAFVLHHSNHSNHSNLWWRTKAVVEGKPPLHHQTSTPTKQPTTPPLVWLLGCKCTPCLSLCAQGLWFSFPVIYTVAKLGLLSVNQEEWLWTVFDFLGKCMFSTSLLQVSGGGYVCVLWGWEWGCRGGSMVAS